MTAPRIYSPPHILATSIDKPGFQRPVVPSPASCRSVLKIGSPGLRESRAGPGPRLEVCLLLNQMDEKESLGGKSTSFGIDCLGLGPPFTTGHVTCSKLFKLEV